MTAPSPQAPARLRAARLASFATLLPLLWVACAAPPEGPAVVAREDAIVGGTPAPSDEQVYLLEAERPDGGVLRCSATLIGRSTLLTAAHCVDPRLVSASPQRLRATSAPALDSGVAWTPIASVRVHPRYEPTSGASDLALLLLAKPSGVAPLPWNDAVDLRGFEGRPLRAVGYGWASSSQTEPLRRQVSLPFGAVSASELRLGDQAGKGICYGDSGGAVLHRFDDGRERLVALVSMTADARCTDGTAVRVDAHRDFISRWLSEQEGVPACHGDGRCKEGCDPVDGDCVCLADGRCAEDCHWPERDPDCPRGCGEDGVCVRSGCARPDRDCAPDGTPCSSALTCEGGRCTTDRQHPVPYCTRPCDASTHCPLGRACGPDGVCRRVQRPEAGVGGKCVEGLTLCRSSVCVPEGARFICRALCDARSRCEEPGESCVYRGSVRICAPEPQADVRAPQTSGCRAGAGQAPALLLAAGAALSLLRLRRGAVGVSTVRPPVGRRGRQVGDNFLGGGGDRRLRTG